MDLNITEMKKSYWSAVSKIYLEGIKTKKATFQNSVPSWEDWDRSHTKSCRLVAKSNDDKILGWAALSPSSSRCVYKGVAEVSIYVSSEYTGLGIGGTLLKELIKESEKEGFWTLYSAIICENIESIKLHKKCGFEQLGIRKKLAKMDNSKWMDVMLLERRSKIVGID